jgi:predicted NUDIX family NTP pyrophosphohydrolase
MAKISAGILLFRHGPEGVRVLLVHPGGPFWRRKDVGAWSIPKGAPIDDENLLQTARREFFEETGLQVEGGFVDLGSHKQAGGKTVVAFALEHDFDVDRLASNAFSIEWPPRSGRTAEFPEVDRAAWFTIEEALTKVTKGQAPIILNLAAKLAIDVRKSIVARE